MDDLSSLSCHRCGVYDASLRQSTHPSVVSVFVAAKQRARVGIWCSRCRGIEAAMATAVSLLAGWWSVRGPALTIAAIRANLDGGQQSASNNARLLRSVAMFEAERFNAASAAMFAQAAHSVQPQRENSRFLDELRRAGHRPPTLPLSPWRFAPWAPVVILVLLLGGIAVGALIRDEPEAVAVKRASLVPQRPAAPAAEPQKTFSFDGRHKAVTHYRTSLTDAKNEIPVRVRRGEDLLSVRKSIIDLATHPGVAELLKNPRTKKTYDELCELMNDVTANYRGGAPVEAIQRTTGESFDATVHLAVNAIVADLRGHEERSDALATQVDARVQGIDEMREDLRIRAVVISLTQQAIDRCLSST
ncbi:MAG TPA: hypothetical protein VGQ36_00045 [Thermoanaerobaculia bacterium]|nr:hypothetical protein [Thermoanaerobaculia bacterium]